MPYIKQDQRAHFDCAIEEMVDTLGSDWNAGDLNYIVSKITWTLFKKNPRYVTANTLIGALECIKLELYRRQIAPYEDEKAKENGDVEL